MCVKQHTPPTLASLWSLWPKSLFLSQKTGHLWQLEPSWMVEAPGESLVRRRTGLSQSWLFQVAERFGVARGTLHPHQGSPCWHFFRPAPSPGLPRWRMNGRLSMQVDTDPKHVLVRRVWAYGTPAQGEP